MSGFAGWQAWDDERAREWIAVPGASADKYSRGVLGVRTGSRAYPGAAVLGVEAAMRTGLGMVRYLGPRRATSLVLQRRPEIVTAQGRVQAWLLGSGMDASERSPATLEALEGAFAEGVPVVCDAGALDLVGSHSGPTVITPHYRELAGLLSGAGSGAVSGRRVDVTPAEIAADPGEWAVRAADLLGVSVLLKGAVTYVASPGGTRLTVTGAPPWLATAGAGDVLGGILGALFATHAAALEADAEACAALAATAALVHGLAAARASAGGPLVALDVAEAIPATIAALLRP
ncbi:NAD(P)H-hydrate dehydratase [Cryobacterium sp. MDB1-18-2]|uniref:ADP-dependent NAD(P)H-hydrate dehydratase n=1 Tax=unclassified Cryobacterium TaxID=2649013 RepID=UPI00106D152A|nr:MULTISPECIES: ADP/ATP-dependent (S)-NAD(P)H-hydrate dehydratase [unclassified Cryobacterium]MDY7526748.1 ADP/ATP-dependent (S)-NAD(P)H-hydrate dehydratase [Cryobacterium sp. 10C2]MEB0201053.1 NAD(P)H-hydrate dehydratase [Cryobacterium sp. 5I3]MEB0291637.1 NAD(P)H-hydrate dehydratase [Cryobacterium sp. 10C2]TFC10825.1 NAD(P)H-hydrate dehydratase [Cryobacterium sp. MDB2-33-2]TFC24010.1 NAD(P)H-hydrate dehydratase [Cryobacterium sp. MDB1-18-2]